MSRWKVCPICREEQRTVDPETGLCQNGCRPPELLGRKLAERMGQSLANKDARERGEPIPYPDAYKPI